MQTHMQILSPMGNWLVKDLLIHQFNNMFQKHEEDKNCSARSPEKRDVEQACRLRTGWVEEGSFFLSWGQINRAKLRKRGTSESRYSERPGHFYFLTLIAVVSEIQ